MKKYEIHVTENRKYQISIGNRRLSGIIGSAKDSFVKGLSNSLELKSIEDLTI